MLSIGTLRGDSNDLNPFDPGKIAQIGILRHFIQDSDRSERRLRISTESNPNRIGIRSLSQQSKLGLSKRIPE
jgi:hypothetical protein